jgi:hypothetical protein
LKPDTPSTRRAAALALALAATLFALSLSACGGGGGGSASSPEVSVTSQGSTAETSATTDHHSEPPNMSAKTAPLGISGGGSAQFRVQGGDNSIQEYGAEADRSDLVQAAKVAHGYLVARAERDWARACGYLSGRQTAQLQQLASSSPQLKGKGCGAILAALSAEVSAAAARELTVVAAASLRSEGDQSFLIYRGAGDTGYFISMTREGGVWRVATLEPTAFP